MNRKDYILIIFVLIYGILSTIPFIYFTDELNKLNPASGGFIGILIGFLVIIAAYLTTNFIEKS